MSTEERVKAEVKAHFDNEDATRNEQHMARVQSIEENAEKRNQILVDQMKRLRS